MSECVSLTYIVSLLQRMRIMIRGRGLAVQTTPPARSGSWNGLGKTWRSSWAWTLCSRLTTSYRSGLCAAGACSTHFLSLPSRPQMLQEEGDAMEGEEFPMAQLTAIVGPHNAVHCTPLIHLALADSAYSLLTTPPDQSSNEKPKVIESEAAKVEVEV